MRRSTFAPLGAMAAAGLIAMLGLGVAGPADAQTNGGEAWTLGLTLPRASATLLKGGGMSWDDVRKNGLVLNARGTGETQMVIHVLTFKDGRLADRWTSRAFTASSGIRPISGAYLPAVQKDARVESATINQPMDVDELLNAGNAGNADILPRSAQSGTFLVMFSGTFSRFPGDRTGWVGFGLEKVSEEMPKRLPPARR